MGPQKMHRRWMFRLCAVLLALLPFVLLELSLRSFDLGSQTAGDPLVGFSEVHPLFELQDDKEVYQTALSRELFFGVQQFAATKPADGYRVFCLGGSTVRGRPYQTDTAFARWLELELATCDPTKKYEVVNCGGLSYASYRLRVMLDEVLQYDPDLIVVATGHNEFLEDRTYHAIKSRSKLRAWVEDRANQLRIVTTTKDLLGRATPTTKSESGKVVLGDTVETRLDDPGGYGTYHRDEAWQQDVITHFEISVRAMIERCKEAGVPLILVRLGSNLRDTAPFKSEHPAELSLDEENAWQLAFEEATLLEQSSAEKALQAYQRAEQIDDTYALLLFRMARVLDRLGRYEDAATYYQKARDHDVCPLRMLTAMSQKFAAMAEETQTPWVDAESLLAAMSDQQIPGSDVYTDHVHPTIPGHQRIATQLATIMRENQFVDDVPAWTVEQRRNAYREYFQSLGINYWVDARERVQWLENWARRQRLYEETLPVSTQDRFRNGKRMVHFDANEHAADDFAAVLAQQPEVDPLLQFAFELYDSGRVMTAEHLLGWLLTQPGTEADSARIAEALLVALVLREDREKVQLLLQDYQTQLADGSQASSVWRELLPDALARAQELLQQEPPAE